MEVGVPDESEPTDPVEPEELVIDIGPPLGPTTRDILPRTRLYGTLRWCRQERLFPKTGGRFSQMTLVRPDVDLVEAPPTPTTHEISLKQENTRKLLAIILLLILAAEVAEAFIWVFCAFYFTAKYTKDIDILMKDILSIIFGPTIALVGAATGFYFGSNAGNKAP
jgi:hypothetical protein